MLGHIDNFNLYFFLCCDGRRQHAEIRRWLINDAIVFCIQTMFSFSFFYTSYLGWIFGFSISIDVFMNGANCRYWQPKTEMLSLKCVCRFFKCGFHSEQIRFIEHEMWVTRRKASKIGKAEKQKMASQLVCHLFDGCWPSITRDTIVANVLKYPFVW